MFKKYHSYPYSQAEDEHKIKRKKYIVKLNWLRVIVYGGYIALILLLAYVLVSCK